MRTQIRIRERFCAALALKDPHLSEAESRRRYGRWTETHGHDFTVEVVVAGAVQRRTHCIMEYSALHRRVRRAIIAPVDHKCLNDVEMLRGVVPTAENMARVFFKVLAHNLPRRLKLVSLTLEDGDGNATIVTEA